MLLIFETHPIQYRAPVYARLAQLCPGCIHVAYASDYSLRGGHDAGFAQAVTWDSDLLAGYPSTVLRTDLTHQPISWNQLDGRGVPALIQKHQPDAILLNSLSHRYNFVAYTSALLRQIPVWMRCETQDQAFSRSRLKTLLRFGLYRVLYSGIAQAFPIGQLNRQHWLRHGLRPHQLRQAHYCTPDRAGGLSIEERQRRRQALRRQLQLQPDQLLVAFFGKLIPKKDPLLLLDAVPLLSPETRRRLGLLYVGSGELHDQLQSRASTLSSRYGVSVHFPGFINQSALVNWYLAADIVVLPSRRAGETWGLVVNEAMQTGCAVVASEAVGCTADFGTWERFRTIPIGSSRHLAHALDDLASFPRSFTWASEGLESYSVEAAAQSLAAAINAHC